MPPDCKCALFEWSCRNRKRTSGASCNGRYHPVGDYGSFQGAQRKAEGDFDKVTTTAPLICPSLFQNRDNYSIFCSEQNVGYIITHLQMNSVTNRLFRPLYKIPDYHGKEVQVFEEC